jgi:hypothetical protein
MPLNYPDILQHNNSVYPIVDSNNILGSVFVTGSNGEQYGISEYKRKLGMIVYFSSSQDFKYYKGGTTASGDWGTSGNWEVLGSNFVSYNFTASFVNQSTWTVNHNLGYRYVIIQTFDTSGNQILPSEITLTNTNTATATFPELTSGTAVVTFGGAAFNNPQLPSNPVNSIQYNNGGIFSGSSNFTFDGNNLTFNPNPSSFYFGNNDNTAIALASINGESDYTRTEIFNLRTITDSRISSFIQSNAIFVGETLFFSNSSVNALNLVYLYSNEWFTVDQGDNTKATQLLAITDGSNTYLREGYIVVAPAGTQTGNQLPIAGTNVKSGMPVYIKEGATTSPFLSTDIPTTGIVRILGHLLYEASGPCYLMHFRPDHTWVEIV